jgi:hypothetical protein
MVKTLTARIVEQINVLVVLYHRRRQQLTVVALVSDRQRVKKQATSRY